MHSGCDDENVETTIGYREISEEGSDLHTGESFDGPPARPKKMAPVSGRHELIFGPVRVRRLRIWGSAPVCYCVALMMGGIASLLLLPPADRVGAALLAGVGATFGGVGLVVERRSPRGQASRRSYDSLLAGLGLTLCFLVLAANFLQIAVLRIQTQAIAASRSASLATVQWGQRLGPISYGDIQTKVIHARIEDGQLGRALNVDIEISNASEVKKVEDSSSVSCRWFLTDEHGNNYKLLEGAVNQSQATPRTLYPGGSYTTRLTFERPVSRAERLDLVLKRAGSFRESDRSVLAHFQILAPLPGVAKDVQAATLSTISTSLRRP